MKNERGIRTTEFWVSLISILGMILGALFNLIPTETVAKLSVYVITAYTIARAIVKITPSKTDDKILDTIKKDILKYFESSTETTKKK